MPHQGTVPPGIETGVYYIPVGNLTFDTTWQQLKDFVKQVAPVEHAEVFKESTTGWVKINGHQNFKKAVAQLNGGLFKGRCLTAFDKNEYEPIMIRFPSDAPVQGSRRLSRSTPRMHPGASVSATSVYGEEAVPMMSPVLSPEMAYSHWGSSASTSDYHAPGPQYSDMSPSMVSYDAGSYAPVASYQSYPSIPSAASVDSCYPVGYTETYGTASSSVYIPDPYSPHVAMAGSSASDSSGGGAYVATERRKLIIKDIYHKTTQEQLGRLVQEAASSDAGAGGVLDVSLHRSSEGNPKSKYAYVVCASTDVAATIQERLHESKLKGGRLSVGFTTEGVSASDVGKKSSALGGASGGWGVSAGGSQKTSSRRKDEKKRKDRDVSSKSGRTASPPGTTGKWDPYEQDSGCDLGRGSSKDHRSSRKQVVIADGSFSRTRRQ